MDSVEEVLNLTLEIVDGWVVGGQMKQRKKTLSGLYCKLLTVIYDPV